MSAVPAPTEEAATSGAGERKIYEVGQQHEDNYLAVSNALVQTKIELANLIQKESEAERTFTLLYTMLLGVWCEARLHKLLYERGVFNEEQRKVVYSCDTLQKKWQKAVEIAFEVKVERLSKHLGTEGGIAFSVKNIFDAITGWIEIHYGSVIETRNKVAHGQWMTAFSNIQSGWTSSDDWKQNSSATRSLNTENILTVAAKVDLLNIIAGAVNNLAVGDEEMQVEKFDVIHAKITKQIAALATAAANYKSHREHIIKGYKLAQERRSAAA